MKVKIRRSNIKYRRKFGFLVRMRSKNGRAIIRRQRRKRRGR